VERDEMKQARRPPAVETVVDKILSAPKYAPICRPLVERLACEEIPKATDAAEAVKRVKRKLHQMVGAYLDQKPPFAAWLKSLETARDEAAQAEWCRAVMRSHASTRERLPFIRAFYATVFAGWEHVASVADLASGLNPLARPFMPIARHAEYRFYDVHRGILDFAAQALTRMGFANAAQEHDLLQGVPAIAGAEAVLLLKTLPCLEQADKTAGRRLLHELRAPLLAVSFPTTSLGGARRGMETFYRDRFESLASELGRDLETHVFPTELLFRLILRP
jgi:16S rRNA (guanine(1405)-N(7))-methyltransferase